MTQTYPVVSNAAVHLQSYYDGPGYPGGAPPLGTAWLTDFVLADGTTQIAASLIPTLQALLTAAPFSRPGLVINIGGVEYSF